MAVPADGGEGGGGGLTLKKRGLNGEAAIVAVPRDGEGGGG